MLGLAFACLGVTGQFFAGPAIEWVVLTRLLLTNAKALVAGIIFCAAVAIITGFAIWAVLLNTLLAIPLAGLARTAWVAHLTIEYALSGLAVAPLAGIALCIKHMKQ